MAGDWIKIHRKIKKSSVWRDDKTLKLWLWLLLESNWEERQLLSGQTLLVGQLILSERQTAIDMNTSRQTIRTGLRRLEDCGNITREPTRDGTIVTICNWHTYQLRDEPSQPTNQPNPNPPPTHVQPTANPPPTQEEEVKKGRTTRTTRTSKKEGGRFAPPSLEDVSAYCEERGNSVNPEGFMDYYQAQGWKLANGRAVRDWKACVRRWEAKNGNRKIGVRPATPTNRRSPSALEYQG